MFSAARQRSDRSALVLIDDDDLRETVAAVVDQLSNFHVMTVADLESTRRAIRECPPSVLIVAPRYLDRDVEDLLAELPTSDPGIVMIASGNDSIMHADAVVVAAPFDVDTFLDAIERALDRVRASRSRIAIH